PWRRATRACRRWPVLLPSSPVADATRGPTPGGLSSRLVALMAVATGAIVANLYYAQPLLHNVASSFGVGSTAAATVVTVTQVGYAAGLLLVVPLGDLHPRRRPAVILFLGAGAGLVFCAAAPSPLALRDRFCRSGMCIGGRAGHDPLRRRPGARGETWSGSGAHHDRFASRYLARPHRQWARGPGGGVAGHLLDLCWPHGLFRLGPAQDRARRVGATTCAVPGACRLVVAPARRRARVASAGCARCVRLWCF